MSDAGVPDIDPVAFSGELEELLQRSPRRRRPHRTRDSTQVTLEAIITATERLIAEHGVDGVRIADVCARSGVGSSSVYHLFGDRDGLIAATLTDRFDRSIVDSGSIRQMSALMADGSDAAAIAEFGRRYLTSTYTDPARQESLWHRVTALAAACHRPPLQERLGDALHEYLLRMAEVFELAQRAGVIRSEVDPVAFALYGQAHHFGLLANRFAAEQVPMQAWEAVAMRTMSMVAPESPEPRSVLPGRVLRVAAATPARPVVPGDERAQAAIELARAAFLAGGPDAVSVAEVRAELGVNAGWFYRAFGDREGLVDEVRLNIFDERLGAETAALVQVLERVRTPEEFTGHMLVLAAHNLRSSSRSQRWFRVEVLSALDGRHGLRRAVAEIDARHVATLVGAIVDAQARGIMADDIDPHAIARFTQSMNFAFLLGSISSLEPTGPQWRTVFERVVWGLTPEVVHRP